MQQLTNYTPANDAIANRLFEQRLKEVLASYGDDYEDMAERKILLEWTLKRNAKAPDLFDVRLTSKSKLPKPLADQIAAMLVNGELKMAPTLEQSSLVEETGRAVVTRGAGMKVVNNE
jgi:hypothetical protein